jgi:primosomal protein N' (replication factor Y) (superfamily II helicase)
VQTRAPGSPVLRAAVHADPGRLTAAESERRASLRLPPATALALVSGDAAAFVAALPATVEVMGPAEGRWLVRADDHRTLCDALASVPRTGARLRVEVDPARA